MVWLMASTCSLRRGGDRRVSPAVVAVEPAAGDGVEMLEQRSGDDPVVGEVGVEGAWVAVSQLEGRGGFPAVGEAVDAFEFDAATGGAQLGEHPTASDGLELARIADEHQAPLLFVGEDGEPAQVAGVEHPGFVHDQRRGRWQLPVRVGSFWSGPFVEQFGDRVGSHPGLAFEDTGGFGRGRHAEYRAMMVVEIVDRGGEHRGLAGAGGTNDHHQPVLAGGCGGGFGLQHIEPAAAQRRATVLVRRFGRRSPT